MSQYLPRRCTFGGSFLPKRDMETRYKLENFIIKDCDNKMLNIGVVSLKPNRFVLDISPPNN